MTTTPTLVGRTVAVTRGRQGDDALTRRLRELGASVLDVPSIAIVAPESFDDLDRALVELPRFEWAVFASQNAVERTVMRLADLGLSSAALGVPKLAAVGRATAERLAAAVRPPDLVPPDARGEALAAALAPLVGGRRVLLPRAAGGRPELLDGLLAAGAEVSAPVAYRTVPAPPEAIAPLADALAAGKVDAVTFASPSSVRSVLAALAPRTALLERAALAAIGPTTTEAMLAAGLRVDVVAEAATGTSLAEAVARHLAAP